MGLTGTHCWQQRDLIPERQLKKDAEFRFIYRCQLPVSFTFQRDQHHFWDFVGSIDSPLVSPDRSGFSFTLALCFEDVLVIHIQKVVIALRVKVNPVIAIVVGIVFTCGMTPSAIKWLRGWAATRILFKWN